MCASIRTNGFDAGTKSEGLVKRLESGRDADAPGSGDSAERGFSD